MGRLERLLDAGVNVAIVSMTAYEILYHNKHNGGHSVVDRAINKGLEIHEAAMELYHVLVPKPEKRSPKPYDTEKNTKTAEYYKRKIDGLSGGIRGDIS